MKNSLFIAAFITILALIWVGSGFVLSTDKMESRTSADQAAPEKIKAHVRVRESQAEDVMGDIAVTGRTEPNRSVDIRAEIAGTVTEILVEKGQVVDDQAVLARLDERDRRARVVETQARVRQRQIEYNAAKELETKGFNSRIKLAQAKTDLDAARADLRKAEIDLANSEIKAPFAAVLDDRMIEVGDYVSIGQTLYKLVDLDPIKLAAYVTEQQRVNLTLGGEAQAVFLDGATVEGTLTYLSADADLQSRTFRIEISLPNPDNRIVAGLTAEILLPAREHKAHKISPSILALDDAGRVGVKIVDDQDTVRFVPITILVDRPDFMWVDGLPPQVRLITVGQDFVTAGQVVEALPADGEGLL